MSDKGWGRQQLNSKIVNELTNRGNVLKKPSKSADELVYLNSNNVWIILQSGINVNSSSKLAESYVLSGGRISGDSFYGPSYSISSFGHRPVPGITEVSIKNYDTFGHTYKATVNIKCWTLEDFEALDRLYFRPGFTILLEWGWTLSWKNGKLVTNSPKKMDFFGQETRDELQHTVVDKRDVDHGTLFGNITNFSYSLNAEGGYDCTVTFIGMGAVIEGMGITPGGDAFIPTKLEGDSNTVDNTSSWIAPIMHCLDTVDAKTKKQTRNINIRNFFIRLAESVKQSRTGQVGTPSGSSTDGFQLSTDHFIPWTLQEIMKDVYKVSPKAGNSSIPEIPMIINPIQLVRTTGSFKMVGNITYVSVGSLLELINVFELAGNNTSFRFNLEKDSKYDNNYLTCPLHFSLNPYVGLIPGRFISSGLVKDKSELTSDGVSVLKYLQNVGMDPKETSLGSVNNVEKLYDPEEIVCGNRDKNKILDLLVSLNYVSDIINQELEQEEPRVLNYIQAILNGMSVAFGGINDFALGIDEDAQTYYIVDRNYICPESDEGTELPTLSVSGLDTTVLSLSANSEVSQDTANQFSVAAQGKTGVSPTLLTWNTGLTERHPVPSKDAAKLTTENDEKKQESDAKKFIVRVVEAYSGLRGKAKAIKEGDSENVVQSTIQNIFSEVAGMGRRWIKQSLDHYTYSEGNITKAEGIFPLRLELTFRGIEGFVVGEIFKVKPGILPRKYDEWAHIVTGVEQKISPSGWTTTVKTMYCADLKGKKLELSNDALGSAGGIGGTKKTKEPSSKEEQSEDDTWTVQVFRNKEVKGADWTQIKDPVEIIEERKYIYKQGSSEHMCARGTAVFATVLVKLLPHTKSQINFEFNPLTGINVSRESDNPNTKVLYKENSYPEIDSIVPYSKSKVSGKDLPSLSTGDANSSTFRQYIEGTLEYRMVEDLGGSKMTVSDIKALESKVYPGDVVRYWENNGKHMHTFVVRPIRKVHTDYKYVSDFLQRNFYCYG